MKRVCVGSLDEIMQTMCEVGDAYNEGQKSLISGKRKNM